MSDREAASLAKREQAALVAFVNSFRLGKRVTAFDQLADGKALMEVMSHIDATHFKNIASRGPSGPGENWVLHMNTLKRLYRLLLSFPLPPPNPSSLSLSSLPEPPFSAIARNPSSSDGVAGLVQICRLCLSVGVWSPGNEMVIGKIQGLGEDHMASLMRSIEEVMETLPPREDGSSHSSPVKQPSRDVSPPPTGLRAERDKLIQDNDELRARCEQMMTQIGELTAALEDTKEERDGAMARLQRESSALRSSQMGGSEVDSLRNDLAKSEDALAQSEAKLEEQTRAVGDLTKQVDELKVKAAEATRLKDRLDEYRHAAEKLQKSENVIEKYKKKLEDAAGLRRELRALEEENSALVNTNATLEAELKKSGSSKTLLEQNRSQIEALERKADEQATQIAELTVQLETAHAELSEKDLAHERDLEELQLHQEKVKELELGEGTPLKRSASRGGLLDESGNTSLGDELGGLEGASPETKTSLKIRIRALQRELADIKAGGAGGRATALETLLSEANKSRDRYQAEYLEAHRNGLRLQANLEQIRSGKQGDESMTAAALRQRLNEVLEERDQLLKDKEAATVLREGIEKDLQNAKVDLSLVDKDQRQQLAILRESVAKDAKDLESKVSELNDQVVALKDKDRLHLEEIKRLLLDKVDLQTTDISQRERALTREMEFGDLRASLAASGASPELQKQLLDLHSRNEQLSAELKSLEDKLSKAKSFIRNQDAMFRADHAKENGDAFEEAQKSYEAQINALKADLRKARESTASLERRYKLEQQLMLSAWHELGSRTVRDHITAAGVRRPVSRPVATSWLGRQRKQQEDASFIRA